MGTTKYGQSEEYQRSFDFFGGGVKFIDGFVELIRGLGKVFKNEVAAKLFFLKK